MGRTSLRLAAILTLSGLLGGIAAPVYADTGQFGSVVDSANLVIKSSEKAQKIAQVPPVTQQPVGGNQNIGLPTGFNYTLDFSIAKPFGDIGGHNGWLPGGMDAVASYGFNPHSRLVANYYELQHYPAGFNTGTKPFYLPPAFPPGPGNPSPVTLNDATVDVTTKDRFFLLYWNFLVNVGKMKDGRSIPVVISPTYVARWSKIAASNNGTDIVAFVDANGIPHTGINTRTAQLKSIAFTVPFLKTPKMFGTFTAAPTWLMHTAGLNQDNHAQLYQILYLEYNPTERTRFFFEPQSSRDYLPTDPYPQHLMAYFLGGSERIGKQFFVQAVLNSGGPTNYAPYGIKSLNCFALPCSANTVPSVGGLKATQLQLQFGIGSPSVLQF